MSVITDTFNVVSIVDGTSPVYLDLDNDNDSIIINEAGQMIIPNGVTIAKLFVGSEQVTSGMMWDAFLNGVNIFNNSPQAPFRIIDDGDVIENGVYIGRELDIEDLQTLVEGHYSIEIGCTYQGHRYTAIWSINIMKGLSKMEINVTPSVMSYNTSTDELSHSFFVIKANLHEQDGTTALTTLPSGCSLRYYTDAFTGTPSKTNGTALNYSGGQASLSIDGQDADYYSFYRFILWDANGLIADEETVPIAKSSNGGQGPKGDDAIAYDINTNINQIVIPTDEASKVVSLSGTFKKRVANAAAANVSLYRVVSYRNKNGNYPTTRNAIPLFGDSSAANSFSIASFTATDAMDAVVVFVYATNNFTTSDYYNDGKYLTKKEIPILKDGDSGNDGEDGEDGNGIVSSVTQYLRTIQPAGVTASTVGDWGAYAEPTEQLPYLWRRSITTYERNLGTSGTNVVKTCELIKTYQAGIGQNLLEGTSFSDMSIVKRYWTLGNYASLPVFDGFSHKVTETRYALSSSSSVRPSSFDSHYPDVIPDGYYLWEFEIIYYVMSGHTVTYTSQMQYAVSSSQTEFLQVTGKGWRTSIYATEAGEYLWRRRVYTFKENGSTITAGTSDQDVLRYTMRQRSTGYGLNGIGIIGEGVQGKNALLSSVQFGPTNIGDGLVALERSFNLKPGAWYTLSFFAKRTYTTLNSASTSRWDTYKALRFSFNYPDNVVDTTAPYYVNGVETTSDAHGTVELQLESEYKQYVITFKACTFSGSRAPSVRFLQPATGGSNYHSELAVCMPKLEEGMLPTGWTDTANGYRTEAKPIPKNAGEFTPGTTYSVTDYGYPYVWMPSENASSGRVYYMLLWGSFTGSASKTPANNQKGNSAGTGQWLQVPYDAIRMVEVLIANGGKVGSAVFWEEFMFSQYGTNANGVPTMDYGMPVQAGGTFSPNFLVNFLNGDLYARTGYFSGFTRRAPTILTPRTDICAPSTDIFEHIENGSISAPSPRHTFLMPDLKRCGAWIVFGDDNDYTFGNRVDDESCFDLLMVLPFMEPFHTDYDYQQGYTYSDFVTSLKAINGWTGSTGDDNCREAKARAISFQGCKIEITNLSQQTICIRGLRGYKWGSYRQYHVQNAWETFELGQNQTIIATCSSYGVGKEGDAGAQMTDAHIAWEVESYIINIDLTLEALRNSLN